jgi:hypothetical protein
MRLAWMAVVIVAVLCGRVDNGCGCKPPPQAPPKAQQAAAPPASGQSEANAPLTYRDAGSGITIFVETDRRHVAAIDPAGKILWHHVVESDFKFVRPDRKSLISSLGKPREKDVAYMKSLGKPGDYIGVQMIASGGEWGLLNVQSGEYFPLGRD